VELFWRVSPKGRPGVTGGGIWSTTFLQGAAHMVRNNSIGELDEAKLSRGLRRQFPAIHFTMISIMQGVALYILAQQVFDASSNGGRLIDTNSSIGFYAGACFLYILLITYEYITIYVAAWEFPVNIFDVIVPVLLGFCEYIPLYYLNNPDKWFFWITILADLGLITFLLRYLHLIYAKHEYGDSLFKKIRNNDRRNLGVIIGMIVILLFLRNTEIFEYYRWQISLATVYLYIILTLILDGLFLVKIQNH
jgi:hypothetical protein